MNELPEGFTHNTGKCPDRARGKRVRVILMHGREAAYDGGAAVPSGWAADGKRGCDWSLRLGDFSIKGYKVL